MKKIWPIVLGWWLYVTNRNNTLALNRLNKCVNCPFRVGVTCGECGCFLQAKARIPEEQCPKYFW